jgi:RNA polymerase sigma-70 factor (ECF subfamily)
MGTTAAVIGTAHWVDFESGDKNVRELHAVLSRHLPSLHRRAFRYLGNAADAEDAVQDALLSAWKHLGKFRGQAQMSTWLTTIVINAARSRLRGQPRQTNVSLDDLPREGEGYPLSEQLPDRGPSPEESCRRSELAKHLAQSARQLSPSLRRAFQLRDQDGLSIREIADVLGVTESTVKTRISRARSRLRDLVGKRLSGQCSGAIRSAS